MFMHSEISAYDIPKEWGKAEQRKERSFPKRNILFTNCVQYRSELIKRLVEDSFSYITFSLKYAQK